MATVHERLMKWLEERGDLTVSPSSCPVRPNSAQRVHDGKGSEVGVLGPGRLRQARAQARSAGLGAPDDPYFEATLADYFPTPCGSGMPRELARTCCAERSSRTRSRTHRQPWRHHLPPSAPVGRPVPASSRWPEPSSSAARSSGSLTSSSRSKPRQRRVDQCADLALPPSSDDACSTGPCGGPSPPAPVGSTSAQRSSASAPSSRRWDPRCPSCSGETSARGPTAGRRSSRAGVPEALARHTASLLDWYSPARHRRDRHRHRSRPTGRGGALPRGLGAVRDRRDAGQGHAAAPRRPVGRTRPGCPPGRPLLVLESLTRGVLDANPADGAASDPGEQYDVWARANQDSISRTKGALSGSCVWTTRTLPLCRSPCAPALGGPRRGGTT